MNFYCFDSIFLCIYENNHLPNLRILPEFLQFFELIVLDLNYEEVYSIDKSKLKDNDLDLVYRRNNLYYEEKIRDGDNLTYNFYNIDNNELAYQVLLGGNDG